MTDFKRKQIDGVILKQKPAIKQNFLQLMMLFPKDAHKLSNQTLKSVSITNVKTFHHLCFFNRYVKHFMFCF